MGWKTYRVEPYPSKPVVRVDKTDLRMMMTKSFNTINSTCYNCRLNPRLVNASILIENKEN